MVHRRAAAEVFLTGAEQQGPDAWMFDVQIPRGHVLLPQRGTELPLILAVEALRQMGLYMGHAGYGIPKDWAFTLQGATFTWSERGALVFPEFAPIELSALVTVTDQLMRKNVVSGLSATIEFFQDGTKVAHGTGELRCISPAHYRALRRRAPRPADVPRRYDDAPVRDLRVVDGGYEATIGYDHANPFFFDHPVDHLPGMLLLHTATHMFDIAFPGSEILGVDFTCDAFPEFEPALGLRVAVDEQAQRVVVTFDQGGAAIGTGIVTGRPRTVTSPPGRREQEVLA